MKNLLFLILSTYSFSQVGINTNDPKVTLDVTNYTSQPTKADGFITPQLKGDELKAKDDLYTADFEGTIIFVTEIPSSTSAKTIDVTDVGYYYFNGTKWVSFKTYSGGTLNDASVLVGGVIYSKFNSTSNGTVSSDNLISSSYTLGGKSFTPNKGGIMSIKGSGYKISNPSGGIFDIQFDTPFTEIYGVSLNIIDVYGTSTAQVSNGANPNPAVPGMPLVVTDNTQVSFISNSIIRVKTGNNTGALQNRSFSFLVAGN